MKHSSAGAILSVEDPFEAAVFDALLVSLVRPDCRVVVLDLRQPGPEARSQTISTVQFIQFLEEAPHMPSLEVVTGAPFPGQDAVNRILARNKRGHDAGALDAATREFATVVCPKRPPKRPRAMTNDEVKRLGCAVVDQLFDLFDASRIDSPGAVLEIVARRVCRQKGTRRPPHGESSAARTIEAQADELLFLQYHCGVAAARAGIPLGERLVPFHRAAMADSEGKRKRKRKQ